MIYAVFSMAATNMASIVALVLSLRSASLERRIFFSASLEADGKTDAARRASAPTQKEAQAAVEQQLKLMSEAKDNGGVFAGNPYARPPKPVGI